MQEQAAEEEVHATEGHSDGGGEEGKRGHVSKKARVQELHKEEAVMKDENVKGKFRGVMGESRRKQELRRERGEERRRGGDLYFQVCW